MRPASRPALHEKAASYRGVLGSGICNLKSAIAFSKQSLTRFVAHSVTQEKTRSGKACPIRNLQFFCLKRYAQNTSFND
jgi:hypothetical protein